MAIPDRRGDPSAPSAAVRKATKADAVRIAELLNAHAAEQHGEAVTSAEEVAHWLRLHDVEAWVGEAPPPELAAYADLREEAERTRYWLDLREHPERRGGGGAAALLHVAEDWAAERAGTGALLRGVVTHPDESLRALYDAAGYRLVRHSLEMRVELVDAIPAPEWPGGFRVRTFVPADEERVYEANMEAFEDHWEFAREPFGAWRVAAVEHPSFDPTLWFLVEAGSEIAGVCLCGAHASGDPAFGYVHVLGVRRRWRRRGLGLSLLLHAFRELRRHGMTRAALDVDAESLTGAVRLYERAGMRVVKHRDILEKPLGGRAARRS